MEFDALLEQRRSIRRYQARPVSKEQITQMIIAAQQAPTWKNSQTGRYHVVMSQPLLDQLKEQGLARFNAENTHDAPVLIVTTFVKDRSGFEKTGEASNELGNGWGCYDLGLQNMNLLLKAEELGLSTLIMDIRDADAIRRLLNIDESETIVSVISVGYRDIDPQKPQRKAVTDITTFY